MTLTVNAAYHPNKDIYGREAASECLSLLCVMVNKNMEVSAWREELEQLFVLRVFKHP